MRTSIQRSLVKTTAIGFCAAFGLNAAPTVTAPDRAAAGPRPTPLPAATPLVPAAVPLVTGKFITPLGRQTNVGSFPANMLLSPDGRFVVVTNVGYRQFVSVLSATDGRLVSQIGFGARRTDGSDKREGLYYGLAFGPPSNGPASNGSASGGAVSGGSTSNGVVPNGSVPLYVSRGAEDKVSVLALDANGQLQNTARSLENPSPIPGFLLPRFFAGLALSGDGARLFAANNNANPLEKMRGALSIFDTGGKEATVQVPLPGFPLAVAALTRGPLAGQKVYVSSEQMGVVSVVDPRAGKETRQIATGAQTTALLLDRAGRRLFAANSGSDTLSVIDTATDRVQSTIVLRPPALRGLPGATPLGIALSPDERRAFVALADMNAVAVVDLGANRGAGALLGYLPAGWYPTSVVVSPDGRRLFVANAKGVNERNPNDKPKPGLAERPQYIQNVIEGTVSTIELPAALASLPRLTAQTVTNNRLAAALRGASGFGNPGIEHIIYIIKENRTYDQVLSDLPRGTRDPSLLMFGREVTPNQHALAERFVLLDNFYCCAEVSGDGWNWSTSGMASEYTARNVPYNYAGRGRQYDFEGQNNGVAVELQGIPDVARSPGGYIWDAVGRAGLSYRNYGFFSNIPSPSAPGNQPTKTALLNRSCPDFRPYDMTYADSDAWVTYNAPAPRQMKEYGRFKAPSRFAAWKREFDEYVRSGTLPRFMMVRLPRDHTSGTTPGASSPRAMVADNDYAVGQLVEAVSRSPFWKKTAIFIVEDDAQNGFDHVDAHRSIAFVVSPFVQRATHDSRFYNTDSVLRTMELLMGLPPMTQYDAIAPPLAVFGARPANDAPFQAILPAREIIAQVNAPTAYRAKDSARLLNALVEESAPDEELNDILWHAIKGRHTPKPARRYGLRLTPHPEP